MPLGCGAWRGFLQCRGGGVLTELPIVGGSMSRRLDDMSDARVTITGASVMGLDAGRRAACLRDLRLLNPWEHELSLWRDGEEVWVGPIVQPKWGVDSIDVVARDLFQWFEKRRLWRNRTFVATDLATIFETYAVDALHHDPTPAIDLAPTPTGITGDRTILAGAYRRAADELRELARSGLDFTFVARQMIVGGLELDVPAIPTLVTEHFTAPGPTCDLDGLSAVTQTAVVGTNRTNQGDPIVGIAGGIDPELGLLQEVFNESSVGDHNSALAAADSRLDLLRHVPEVITGALASTAPVIFDQLVPGARCPLKLALLARDVDATYRLHDLAVSFSDQGETVTPTFVTIGTVDDAT
ncbi:MAG TPA: hypothetical protein VFA83_15740 [Acidimicrobiales bacterium]|nr:hypothetical protein [Acidimicrobiales bacterium]